MRERHLRSNRRRRVPGFERCDERTLLATFLVINPADAGPGTLRQAILDANAAPGQDRIAFEINGTVLLASGALPAFTDDVYVDGTTAPGYQGKPVIEIDANGFAGLRFAPGARGSVLNSVGIVRAGGDGIVLDDGNVAVAGCYVGVRLGGTVPAGNAGDGIRINAGSTNNFIGVRRSVVAGGVISVASNVISANGGAGISIRGSSGNLVQANYVGTDATGTRAIGNAGAGVLLDSGARGNSIGGAIHFPTGSTDPARQSNLISGNFGDGVRIANGSSNNVLSANFVGTDVMGLAPLGNFGDGVAILDGATGNSLAGTTATGRPFAYANIVGGNRGNGLRIANADGTVVVSNYFGVGRDDVARVGNTLDGVLIEGSSAGTRFGGSAPLGNVVSANGRDGVEVKDTARNTTISGTFCGVGAFSDRTDLGNGGNGMTITSTGVGNTVHTGNILSRNRLNGIEIGGSAAGVSFYGNLVGVNAAGAAAMPNGGDGVRISGAASGNSVGVPIQTTGAPIVDVPRTIISGNQGRGVAIVGTAANNRVANSYIGTSAIGTKAVPNGGAGVYLGPKTTGTTIGGTTAGLGNLISGNLGDGIEIDGSNANTIVGDRVGTDASGASPLPNAGDGISLTNASNNAIGGTIPGAKNVVAFNKGAGVFVKSANGNSIRQNAIFNNRTLGILLRPGANDGQAAPILTHVAKTGKITGVGGFIRSSPRSTFQIELFANRARGTTAASGETYVATVAVTTDDRGLARFAFRFRAPTAYPVFYTATATNATNDTSRFSNRTPR